METVNQHTVKDQTNGISLPRHTVTSLNVGDLPTVQTAKQGTKYEVAPGKVCVAKKATLGRSMALDDLNEEIDAHEDDVMEASSGKDYESPWHWFNLLVRRVSLLADPVGFTWDQFTPQEINPDELSVDVLQRVVNDFLYRINAQEQRLKHV